VERKRRLARCRVGGDRHDGDDERRQGGGGPETANEAESRHEPAAQTQVPAKERGSSPLSLQIKELALVVADVPGEQQPQAEQREEDRA
jgi:hypothetical protein